MLMQRDRYKRQVVYDIDMMAEGSLGCCFKPAKLVHIDFFMAESVFVSVNHQSCDILNNKIVF